MNDTLTSAENELLGARLDAALSRRDTAASLIDIGAVRAGARRRQVYRRIGAGFAAVALLAGGVTLVAQRRTDRSMTAATPPAAPGPVAIAAVAGLPATFGEPTALWGSVGGQPYNVVLPRIDVWTSTTRSVVVRTFPEAQPDTVAPEVSLATATTAAPGDADGPSEGAIEQLAADQWVKYLSPDGDRGTNVVIRGADKAAAIALFDALREIDGVLTPPDDFALSEHLDALPASTPAGWGTQIEYSHHGATLWVSTFQQATTPGSPAAINRYGTGSLHTIGGRAVVEADPRYPDGSLRPGRSVTWLDDSGLVISVHSNSPFDDSVIEQVELVSQSDYQAMAAGVSARLATKPQLATANVAGQWLRLRGVADDVVACIGSGSIEQCSADLDSSAQTGSDGPIAGTMDAIVDGHWVVFGYYQLGDFVPNVAADRYSTPDGTLLPIVTRERDGFLWYVIAVPDDVNVITAAPTNNAGGVVGQIARPLVIGALG